jgi:hypothetical protein
MKTASLLKVLSPASPFLYVVSEGNNFHETPNRVSRTNIFLTPNNPALSVVGKVKVYIKTLARAFMQPASL